MQKVIPPNVWTQVSWERLLDLDEQVAYYQRYGDSRFNKGTELANVVEVVAHRRAAAVFSTEWADNSDISVSASDIYVNLQCPTGSLANTAVFEALAETGRRRVEHEPGRRGTFEPWESSA